MYMVNAVENRQEPSQQLRLYCLGDSITAGVPGVSYCRYLTHRPLVQDGKGGDTVFGLKQRLKAYAPDSASIFVIEIGTNDIMLPYLKTLSDDWSLGIDAMERKGLRISSDRDEFLQEYQAVLEHLAGARVLCVSIPCIGENMGSPVNARVDFYNQGIEQLCSEHNKTFIDFNRWQKSCLKDGGSAYFIQPKRSHMLLDILLSKGLFLTSRLSRSRQLVSTLDGVHLNHYGAQNLARLISACL